MAQLRVKSHDYIHMNVLCTWWISWWVLSPERIKDIEEEVKVMDI